MIGIPIAAVACAVVIGILQVKKSLTPVSAGIVGGCAFVAVLNFFSSGRFDFSLVAVRVASLYFLYGFITGSVCFWVAAGPIGDRMNDRQQ